MMKNQKTDRTQPSVRITMPWPWLTFRTPRTMQSTPQMGPTMAAILINLLGAILSAGKTALLSSRAHPHAKRGARPGHQEMFIATVGRPGWHSFAVLEYGVIVAGASLYVHGGAGAWRG
jgi:hypothetical protein